MEVNVRSIILFLFLLFLCPFLFAQNSVKFEDLNWMEVQKTVPKVYPTVLIAAGTIEAHGVTSNSTDMLIPNEIAMRIAKDLNALVAPAIPYGATRSLNHPGGIVISDETLQKLYYEVLDGLHRTGFKNIIVINGHGPNRTFLDKAAEKLCLEKNAHILIVDWWSYTEKISLEYYKDRGGHAGSNENGAVLAIDPKLVKKELYSKDLAIPTNKTYSAYPSPGSILIYDEGKGYPDFDEKKAKDFLNAVCQSIKELAKGTIEKWERQGF
jgi:creatinine amidohydrolase